MASEANDRLIEAARDGDVAGISAALLAGANPNALVDDWTPLLWAADCGHVASIAALLAAGAYADGANTTGFTPLTLAAMNGHTHAFDVLLDAGADVNHADNDGFTALHCACASGYSSAACRLIEAGARTDVRNQFGQRPIDSVRYGVVGSCAPLSQAATLLHCGAQVRGHDEQDEETAPLRALFTSAAPWSRRRPVAIACYAVEWEA
jgi:hypothetical protein